MKTQKYTKGFTLVELICVMAILALLLAIVIPACTGWIVRAKESRLRVEARSLQNSVRLYVMSEIQEKHVDSMTLMEELSAVSVKSPQNPIYEYLTMMPTDDMMIENVVIEEEHGELQEIVILSKEYRISIVGKEIILERR